MTRLLITTDAIGGVWQYTLELVRGLAREDVDIGLAVMGAPLAEDQREELRGMSRLTVHARPFKLEWMRDAEKDLRSASSWLLDLADELEPDVVHVNGYYHAALPWGCPVVLVAHSCVSSWWEAVRRSPLPEEWNAYRKSVRRGLGAATMVVAPTRHMLATLRRHYGSLGPSCVIHNGRDLPEASRLSRWKDPLVVGAGRVWDEAKNLATLASIADRVEWPIVIAGELEHPEGGRAAAPNAREARLLGRVSSSEMLDWMRRASIYCLPARYEPFGLTPLEAAQCGCALVLSDIPTFREIWSGAAELVPLGDPGALARAVDRLIHDPARLARMAERAARRARRFRGTRMAQSYAELYRELRRQETAGAGAGAAAGDAKAATCG